MLRFKNPDNLPATPKSWTTPSGHKIPFNSVQQTWGQFIARVMSYYEQNSLPLPSIAEIENHICHQISSWACMDENGVAARTTPAKQTNTPTRRCGACGK
jgi:hypothetical protein